MKTVIALLLAYVAAASAGNAFGEGGSFLVLKIKSYATESDGSVVATLESGTQLKFKRDDVDLEVTARAAYAELKRQDSARAAPAKELGPHSMISAKCARDWPDDFSMRAYCQDKQYAGAKKLAGREATSATMRTIRDKCERDWPDDFAMETTVKKSRSLLCVNSADKLKVL